MTFTRPQGVVPARRIAKPRRLIQRVTEPRPVEHWVKA
jgi:hypothetical protein